jgi:hypothetical protein
MVVLAQSCRTVSYVLDKIIEKGIDQARITVTIMPYDSTSSKRLKRDAIPVEMEVVRGRTYDPPENSSFEWLEYARSEIPDTRKTWMAAGQAFTLQLCGSVYCQTINVNLQQSKACGLHLKKLSRALGKQKATTANLGNLYPRTKIVS